MTASRAGVAVVMLSFLMLALLGAAQPIFPPTVATAPYNTEVMAYHWANVLGPPSLAGALTYMPAAYGPHFPLNGTLNGAAFFQSEIVLPNVNDDPTGCTGSLQSTNEFGESFVGKIVMLQQGGCQTPVQALAVTAVGGIGLIVVGASPITFVPYPYGLLWLTNDGSSVTLPAVYISMEDGSQITKYLLARNVQKKDAGSDATLLAALPSIVSWQMVSTGALDATEKTAVYNIISGSTMGDSSALFPTYSTNSPWNAAFSAANKDPCLNRLVGIWCENGHITAMLLSGVSWSGSSVLSGIGSFTHLTVLLLDGNGLFGDVPNSWCGFSNLRLLSLGSQGGVSPSGVTGLSSLPTCMSSYTKLQGFWISFNSIGNMPDFAAAANSLITIDIGFNPVPSLPASFSTYKKLVFANLINAALTQLPSFAGFTSLFYLATDNNAITTPLTPTSFDNLPSLNTLSMVDCGMPGQLPLFAGTAGLQSLTLSGNQLNGTIPSGWATNIPDLIVLNLNNNKLVSPVSSLVLMKSLTTIQLANNLFTADTGNVNQLGNVGPFLKSVAPTSVVTLQLDSNKLAGFWTIGVLYDCTNLKTLTLSNNKLTQIPVDLFINIAATYVDVSNNNITVWGEVDAPKAAYQYFNIQGNPGLVPAVLPPWIVFDNNELTTTPGLPYACPALSSSTSTVMKVLTDYSFTSYHGCLCANGTFGFPPLCQVVPLTAVVAAGGGIFSEEIGSTFSHAVALAGGSSAVDNNATSFSDTWYGNARLTIGLSTSWTVNPRLFNSSGYVVPTRTIKLTFHISRALFVGANNILAVYAGPNNLGTRVKVISGTDVLPSVSNTSETTTSEYLATYGAHIAELGPSAIVEVYVFAEQATVSFSSRDLSGAHFVSTFVASTECPDGHFFDSDLGACRVNLAPFFLSSSVRILVWCISALAALCTLVCIAIVLKYWHHSVIRSASRPFMLLMAFLLFLMALGAMLYAAVPDDYRGKAICNGRAWLTVWPLTGVLAILLAKTKRISGIFTARQLRKIKQVSDVDLLINVLASLTVVSIFLAIYSGVPLSSPKSSEGSGSQSGQKVYSCSQESGFNVWIGLLLAYMFSMLLAASFFAFKTRDVPTKYNESAHIMNAVLLALVYGILIVPLSAFIQTSPDASVLIQGLGQALAVILLSAVLFGPKMHHIRQAGPDGAGNVSGNTFAISGNRSGTRANLSGLPVSQIQSPSIAAPSQQNRSSSGGSNAVPPASRLSRGAASPSSAGPSAPSKGRTLSSGSPLPVAAVPPSQAATGVEMITLDVNQ